jgi:spore coat polysaccharide biosynthesis protein SpsF
VDVMRIVAVLQARITSSRFPGKVLKPILGKPMLQQQIERIQRSERIDRLIVATSREASDNPIASLCETMGVSSYRGSLDDVLDRVFQAVSPCAPDHVVRLTGDCPLADAAIIDDVIAMHLAGDYDYTSNCNPPTFPDGLDVEVVRFSALQEAWNSARLLSEREHVTPFIRNHSERFKIGNQVNPRGDFSAFRWTVDMPADFEMVAKIYAELYPKRSDFDTEDVLQLIASRPELAKLNSHFLRNEGFLKSLSKDAEFVFDKKGS